MATHLDLEEQEQLDQLKHFWNQYGNLITWVLILVLAAFAAWNGWQWWQREQAAKAAALYDELERAAQAGDAAKATRAFEDIRERFGSTAYAEQAGLLAARTQFDKGQADAARTSLAWVAEHASEAEYRSIARLRLAALLLEAKQYDEALRQLDAVPAGKDFEALVEDRRGDVLAAKGDRAGAKAAYRKAFARMDPALEYRRLVEAKLIALGGSSSPAAAGAGGTPAAGASGPAAAASGSSR